MCLEHVQIKKYFLISEFLNLKKKISLKFLINW